MRVFNCVYDDGVVVPVDDPAACPLREAELVDVTELSTVVNVTADEPVGLGTLALAALAFLVLRRKS